jgi:hypothetical protein
MTMHYFSSDHRASWSRVMWDASGFAFAFALIALAATGS